VTASRAALATLGLLALLAGCTERIAFERESSDSPIDPAPYARAIDDGAAVYRVDPDASFVLVRVGRAGRMAQLGHEHAVASEDLEGFVAVYDDPARSRASIALPLKELVVDAPAYRERLGLDTEPSADDIAGTYSNMRKTLDAETFPWVEVEARFASADSAEMAVSLTLHGMRREFVVPVTLATSNDQLAAGGSFAFEHADFGLEPFSAAGGLLRVADRLEVSFQIVADRLPQDGRAAVRGAP
jgi:polyisoprenoid-binding protein YceI